MLWTDAVPAPSGASLGRTQLIDAIIETNPSATETYLSSFDDDSLRGYFEHLLQTRSPRGTRWRRPTDARAISTRESAF